VHYDGFFYPLDGIHQWNRMYGRNGFTQYQFVLPKDAGLNGMRLILKRIADSGLGSFLSVDSAATSGLFLNILSQKRLAYAAAIPFAATVLRT